jgi:hypothetical protein
MSKTLTIGATLIIGVEIDIEIEDKEAWTATFGNLDLDNDCDEIAQKIIDRLRVTPNTDGTIGVTVRDRSGHGVLINTRHPVWNGSGAEFESPEVAAFEGTFEKPDAPDAGDDEENDGSDPDPSEDPS